MNINYDSDAEVECIDADAVDLGDIEGYVSYNYEELQGRTFNPV